MTGRPSHPSDFSFSPPGGKSSENALAWLAAAARAHATIEVCAENHASAFAKAQDKILALWTRAIAANAAAAYARANGTTDIPMPSPDILAAHTAALKALPAGAELSRELRILASAARAAGYAEAQADLVLELMLTEEGRSVLEGLAAITNVPP